MKFSTLKPTLLSVTLAVLTSPVLAAAAQTATFEVASVKQAAVSNNGGKEGARESLSHGPDSITMRNVTLKTCIGWAWDAVDYQISGPAWLGSGRYDITAKAGSPVPVAQLKIMLQTLLTGRLHLTLHKEVKDLPVYELVPAKKGPMFHPSEGDGESSMRPEGGNLVFRHFSMPDLAEKLPLIPFRVDRPVVDRTQLPGKYDFQLRLADNGTEMKTSLEHADAGFIFDLIQTQLGLKLNPRKDPISILVIDQADKVPTEN